MPNGKITNKELFDEINRVKIILVGDDTKLSREDSVVYRLEKLERDRNYLDDNPGTKKPFRKSDVFLKIVDKAFSFAWKIALFAILGEKALSLLPK